MTLVIDGRGNVHCLYSEVIDLLTLGRVRLEGGKGIASLGDEGLGFLIDGGGRLAAFGKPAAAPCPVRKQWVNKGPHDKRRYEESRIFPAFCRGACHDRDRSVHEHHLKEEQRRDRRREHLRRQEEARHAEQTELFAGEGDGVDADGRRRIGLKRYEALDDAPEIQVDLGGCEV